MRIIKENITLKELDNIAKSMFGNLVKAVVDVEKEIMAVGGELSSDEEAILIENGSKQNNLWGINIYPEIKDDSWIEFDSMINIQPSQKNLSRGIDNPKIKKTVIDIVNRLVKR